MLPPVLRAAASQVLARFLLKTGGEDIDKNIE